MWFAATILFRSEIDGLANLRPLCEERVVLFQAVSENEAQRHATLYAQREEHAYKNRANETVTWVFVAIEGLEVLDLPSPSGWPVASKYVRRTLRTLRRLEAARSGR